MSYLSNFGSNFTSIGTITGTPGASPLGFSPILIAVGGSSGSTTTVISTNSSSAPTGNFSGSQITLFTARAFSQIRGYGPTLLNNSYLAGNQTMDFRDTIAIDNVGIANGHGNNVNATNSSAAVSLTTWTNFSWQMTSTYQTWILQGCSSLANFSVKQFYNGLVGPGSDFRITGAALTAQSIENILVAADAGVYSGSPVSFNLTGGTSSGASALTPAASAARTSLIAKGCTVALNP